MDVIAAALRLARAAAGLEAFVERGGTPAMLATLVRARDLCMRVGLWAEARAAVPSEVPLALEQCLERIPALADSFEDLRAICEELLAAGRLDRVAGLADVFVSIDEVLGKLDREMPRLC